MKIAITSQGKEINSQVDARLGRAKGFIIYDYESNEFNYVDNNQNLNALQGAGIQAAKKIIDNGTDVVITGNVGPKAFAVFQQSGIEIYTGAKGTIADSIDDFRNNKLKKATGANVESHW